jgi:tRNA-specific 2-thiouridylase
VTRGRYDEFVRGRRDLETSGELVTTDGKVVARHAGIEAFTVGQRKGLGVALGDRKFVVRIDAESRCVTIGGREDLYQRELAARDCNWLDASCSDSGPADAAQRRCFAQIRYNAEAQPATMTLLPERRLHLRFDEPQFAITPGQAVVCYDADDNKRVLGGGWIE